MKRDFDKSEVPSFEFGENWQQFITSNYDKERVRISQEHLLKFLRLKNLAGKVFLDIGCGSGIHSLAAYMAGAKKVISFDYDEKSVAAAQRLHNDAGSPANWVVLHGSVLDRKFMESIESVDIVYSWGVLHHTGEMWNAIRNSVIPLNENGVYYIALYAYEVYQNPSPEFWIDIKQKYNLGNANQKEELEYWYAWERVLKGRAISGENPFHIIRDYKKSRGMEFWTDVRDWLGGYPMEFAKARDVSIFSNSELGMEVLDINSGEGNTEYLMRKVNANNYWDEILDNYHVTDIPGPYTPVNGHCYSVKLSDFVVFADTDHDQYKSPLMLYENSVFVGFPHARHQSIVDLGEGRYSHWDDRLLFSTPQNMDPNTTGCSYSIRIPKL